MAYFKNPIKKGVLHIRGTNSTLVFIIIICIHKNLEMFNEKDILKHKGREKWITPCIQRKSDNIEILREFQFNDKDIPKHKWKFYGATMVSCSRRGQMNHIFEQNSR